jgi:Gram-negative bacterial TonB protein C-terminal
VSHAEQRILTLGIAGSLVVHLVAAFSLATWVAFAPAAKPPPKAAETPVEIIMPENIEVATVPAPTPAPPPTPEPPKPQTPPPPPPRRFIETEDNEASAKAPDKAGFISDRSTVASAKIAPDPKAEEDLPSTKGVKVKTMDLANREYKDGELKNDRPDPAPPSPPPTPPPAPEAIPEPPAPPPPPKAEPLPPPEKMAKKDDSSAEKMMKELDAALLKENKEPAPELKKPQEHQSKTPDMKLPEEPPLPQTMPLPPPAPPALKTAKNEFVPQKRTSEVKGKISNIGAQDSVDAIETAEGRYVQAVRSAIRKRWQFHTMQRADFLQPCDIVVQFSITKDGKPKDVRIVSSNGNAVVTDFTLSSVLEAKIPPIPEDLRKQMGTDVFEMPMEFVVY